MLVQSFKWSFVGSNATKMHAYGHCDYWRNIDFSQANLSSEISSQSKDNRDMVAEPTPGFKSPLMSSPSFRYEGEISNWPTLRVEGRFENSETLHLICVLPNIEFWNIQNRLNIHNYSYFVVMELFMPTPSNFRPWIVARPFIPKMTRDFHVRVNTADREGGLS